MGVREGGVDEVTEIIRRDITWSCRLGALAGF